MGVNVPDDRNDEVIAWFRVHVPLWAQDPARLGVSSAQIAGLAAALDAAALRTQEAASARQAAVTATQVQNDALAELSGSGRRIVNLIKSFITAGGDGALWGLAGLAAPDGRGTAAAPAAPSNLSAELGPVGVLTVRWQARQPRGVSNVTYPVRRGIDGGPWEVVDVVGRKRYTDGAVPAGARAVRYCVQPRCGGRLGGWSPVLMVQFGVEAVGAGVGVGNQSVRRAA